MEREVRYGSPFANVLRCLVPRDGVSTFGGSALVPAGDCQRHQRKDGNQ